MNLTGPETNMAAELLHTRIGLKPDPSFRPRLTRALRDVSAEYHLNLEALVQRLTTDTTVLDALVDRVTVQETAFFRHVEQFEALARELVPTMTAPLRAWSAACANGQEAYSLAMLLKEATPMGQSPPKVLATDVSPAALLRTTEGRYTERELTGVNARQRAGHFTATINDQWQLKDDLRRLVTVQRYNLLDPIPAEVAECQIVMCRNVLIYFSQGHAEAFLDRLADIMQPDAYLFVGGAETLWQMTERFEPIQLGACFVYRQRNARPARLAISSPARSVSQPATPHRTITRHRAPLPTQPRQNAHGKVIAAPTSDTATGPSGVVDPTVSESPSDLELRGRVALAAGEIADAVVLFRRWAYISPDDPTAHFHLGSTLCDANEVAGARRAFRAALAALQRCDDDQLARCLKGYDVAEFRRLLTDRSNLNNNATLDGPTAQRQKRTSVRT